MMRAFEATTAPLTGTNLVEASAGTGKTFTIGTLYLRALVEGGLRPGAVLVVTYTKAATAELRGRLRDRIREALDALTTAEAGDADLQGLVTHWETRNLRATAQQALAAALRDFDEAAVHTIHGFCQRMLQELAFESCAAFDAELATDEAPLRDEIVRDFWVQHTHDAPAPLLRHVHASGISPEALLGLALRVGGDPSLPILPATVPPAPGAIDAALDAHRDAVRAANAIWARDRAVIADLLGSPSLKRNVYRSERVDGWLRTLDEMLATDVSPWPEKLLPLWRLTPDGLTDGTRKRETPPVHPFFEACDTLHRAAISLRSTLTVESRRLCRNLVDYVRRERRRRRDATRTRSFDDLQLLLQNALTEPGGDALATAIRHRFPLALIDECQDTDPLQHAIFDRIYSSPPGTEPNETPGSGLYRIGDPKQAIFAFRGADVFTYLAAKRDAGTDARTLTVNWRSDPRLIQALNTVFASERNPFLIDDIVPQAVRPRPGATDALPDAGLHFLSVPDGPPSGNALTRHVAAGVAADIACTLTRTDRSAGHVAVLCRTNKQAIAVQTALRARRIPSVLHGDKSVFDTPEADEIQRVAQAMATPADAAVIRSALATTILGVDGPTLHALQGDERAWDAWTQQFDQWHALWNTHRFVRAFRQLLGERGVHQRLLGLTDGERRLTNVLHLVELLHRAESEGHRGPAETLRWLQQMRLDPAARGAYAGDAEQVRLESDEDAVTVVTIHKSKGLEYPIVYCPFLWENATLHPDEKRWIRFHDPAADDRLTLDLGSDAHEAHAAVAEREAFAESLRLTYVALTRARHQCAVVWGGVCARSKSALAYLLHQPHATGPDQAATRLDPALVRRELEELVAGAPNAFVLRDLADPTAPLVVPPVASSGAAALAAREPLRRVPAGRRASSFSALIAAERVRSMRVEEGIDHDDLGIVGAPPGAPPGTPSGTLPESDDAGASGDVTAHAAAVALDALPAGAATGQLLHDVLQYLDFQRTDPTELPRLVGTALARHGFGAQWAEPTVQALDAVLDTPLGLADGPDTLGAVQRADRVNEMEFTLPATRRLTAGDLAAVFTSHHAPPQCPAYGTRVQSLGFEPVEGHLRGFVDLVFRFEGRWYLADYKSNHLGATPNAYAPAQLAGVMAAHHYVLQYHLYALALHRHLRTRLPDYVYARDFGGVLYLFLRGMAPHHQTGCGVFYDRPTNAVLGALDAVVDPR